MAGTTGLEPATSDVTGRRSNQLNYVPVVALLPSDTSSVTQRCATSAQAKARLPMRLNAMR